MAAERWVGLENKGGKGFHEALSMISVNSTTHQRSHDRGNARLVQAFDDAKGKGSAALVRKDKYGVQPVMNERDRPTDD